jgi:hypothetical protein
MSIHDETTQILYRPHASQPDRKEILFKQRPEDVVRSSLLDRIMNLDAFLAQIKQEPDLEQFYDEVLKIVNAYKEKKGNWQKWLAYLSQDNTELHVALCAALEEYSSEAARKRWLASQRAATEAFLAAKERQEAGKRSGILPKKFPYGGTKRGSFDITQNPPRQITN